MLLEKLSNAIAPSGYEGEVRKIIIEEIKPYVDELNVDRMGNIIAHKKGKGKRVLVDAHMDEVGFIIIGYNEDGTLRFNSLGGVNEKIAPCKVLYIGENKIKGVVGLKAIHLQSKEERTKGINYEGLCIDIGAIDRAEAEKYVSIGDYAVFDTKFGYFGDGFVKGKALDDRVGCFLLAEALKENYSCDFYAVFNVQEEVGRRGAFGSSFRINPEIGIALEGTVCADMPNVPEHLGGTYLGRGPAISIMDGTSIFDVSLREEIINTAKKINTPYQMRRAVTGGNDAGPIHGVKDGSVVAAISIPCRYIHSSVSVASISDIENGKKLLINFLKGIA
jgi:putative aminopeptidase FrvX